MRKPSAEEVRRQQAAFAAEQAQGSLEHDFKEFHLRALSMFLDRPAEMTWKLQFGEDRKVSFSCYPHPDDVAKVVGSRGNMFHSIRAIMQQFAARLGVKVHYSVESERRPPAGKVDEFQPDEKWPKRELEQYLHWLLAQLFDHPARVEWYDVRGRSQIGITLDATEPVRVPDVELRDSIGRLMHAVGRAKGRLIFVESVERRAS